MCIARVHTQRVDADILGPSGAHKSSQHLPTLTFVIPRLARWIDRSAPSNAAVNPEHCTRPGLPVDSMRLAMFIVSPNRPAAASIRGGSQRNTHKASQHDAAHNIAASWSR